MATILIVDDLPANRHSLTTLLLAQQHRLIEAANGSEALALVQAEQPDLIITDVLMPVMDGYELVRRLRNDPHTRKVPVLFYTAPYGEREARARALGSGVPWVLRKPAEPDEVLRIVGNVLSGKADQYPPGRSRRSEEFDREHLRLLTDELSEKDVDLRAANVRLRALVNIGLELGSLRRTDQLIDAVCTAATDLFGASYVSVGIVDQTGETVDRIVTCGGPGQWIERGDLVPGFLKSVVSARQALRGENPGGEPTMLQLPPGHPAVRAYLAAPVASPTRVYGWLCLAGDEGRTFSADDEDMVMALAGQVGRIYEIEHEISERRDAEEALRKALEELRIAEERMRFTLLNTGVGIWDMDYATGVLRWSETLQTQYGLEPGSFAGTFPAFLERINADDRAEVVRTIEQAVTTGKDFTTQHRSIQPDGTFRWLSGAGKIHLDGEGKPLRGVGISIDITDRRTLEAQYQQAQKLEAVGRLAGGVAHDFNNLLTAILGSCELVLDDLGADDPRRADMMEIQKAGFRAAGLTRQLLAFSRKEIIQPILLDLNAVVTDIQSLLGRLLREDVRIVLQLRAATATIKVDRGELEQVVMNLAVNAQDAMPHGGTLTIETANVELDEHYARTHFGVNAGPHVALAVSDTGTGISPEVQSRLFEPFFTTKGPGKGTGLGLATVHGIVERSGGSVTVHSELGHGTSFKVYLPLEAGTAAIVLAPVPTLRRHGDHPETVLVVEDAIELRQLTTRLLERQGYKALVAGNAPEAMLLFEQHADIDVLLTDVVMPGASGPELTKLLLATRPRLRVVYMSGYTEDSIIQHGVLNGDVAFLHKPFTSDALGRKIREVLDAPEPVAEPVTA